MLIWGMRDLLTLEFVGSNWWTAYLSTNLQCIRFASPSGPPSPLPDGRPNRHTTCVSLVSEGLVDLGVRMIATGEVLAFQLWICFTSPFFGRAWTLASARLLCIDEVWRHQGSPFWRCRISLAVTTYVAVITFCKILTLDFTLKIVKWQYLAI